MLQYSLDEGEAEVIELNGRRYRAPREPVVVICVDEFGPAYLDHGVADGVLPTIAGFARDGWLGLADAVMPTFTNPNNVSIVTGAPPAMHGIAGNYYLDRDPGREVMITDDRLLRSETILGLMSSAGVATAAVTAKDKLRRIPRAWPRWNRHNRIVSSRDRRPASGAFCFCKSWQCLISS
jgi:phosphonoacetate hydrolase